MSPELRKRLPSKEDWEVARCLVETMKDVVGSITMNQTNGSNWLLSDAIADFIHVYLQCSSSNDIPSVEKRLQELLHEESYSSDARNLVINLKDLCQKIIAKQSVITYGLFWNHLSKCPLQKNTI